MAMSNKVLIGCIAAVLLIGAVIACGVGGIFILGFNSQLDKTENEGIEFGRTTDQRGCQGEALRRFREATKTGNIVKRREQEIFLNGCFQTCRATPNYCVNAPKEDSFLTVRSWAQQECAREGFGGEAESACVSLFMQVSNACFGRIKRAN